MCTKGSRLVVFKLPPLLRSNRDGGNLHLHEVPIFKVSFGVCIVFWHIIRSEVGWMLRSASEQRGEQTISMQV